MTFLPLWRPPAVQEAPDSEKEIGYRIYELFICFRDVLYAENDEQAHKLVLCGASTFFYNALSVNMKKEGVSHCVL